MYQEWNNNAVFFRCDAGKAGCENEIKLEISAVALEVRTSCNFFPFFGGHEHWRSHFPSNAHPDRHSLRASSLGELARRLRQTPLTNSEDFEIILPITSTFKCLNLKRFVCLPNASAFFSIFRYSTIKLRSTIHDIYLLRGQKYNYVNNNFTRV